MFNRSSDKEWQKYGRQDPYYGVVSLDKFRQSSLDDAARDEFFESGRTHIEFVTDTIRRYVDPAFGPVRRSLDFGCGVGRCLIPMASMSRTAVGVDVSREMLDEAGRNARARSVDNLELLGSDDSLSGIEGPFDFIHCFAVFQHIPPARGEKLFERLLALLGEGGVIAVQLIYDRRVSRVVKLIGSLRKRVPLVHPLLNIINGEKASKPLMEKNCYNLNRLLTLLKAAPCVNAHIEFEGKDEMRSLILFARKDSEKEVYDYEAFFDR